MQTHQEIDLRSLSYARAIVNKINKNNLSQLSIENAKQFIQKSLVNSPCVGYKEWEGLLNKEWKEIRKVLTEESEYGNQIRQCSPFVGVLSNSERMKIFKEHLK